MQTSTILNVTFDCADPAVVARFWAAVTGWSLHREDVPSGREEYRVGPSAASGIRLYFVGVPEAKVVKNRIHLDILPPDGDPGLEVARLRRLGASVPDDQPDGASWLIMADPEGNEFCLEGGRS
ncbi:MAG TPA: VOC family protein [Streptosporangiaceae bacterium]